MVGWQLFMEYIPVGVESSNHARNVNLVQIIYKLLMMGPNQCPRCSQARMGIMYMFLCLRMGEWCGNVSQLVPVVPLLVHYPSTVTDA